MDDCFARALLGNEERMSMKAIASACSVRLLTGERMQIARKAWRKGAGSVALRSSAPFRVCTLKRNCFNEKTPKVGAVVLTD